MFDLMDIDGVFGSYRSILSILYVDHYLWFYEYRLEYLVVIDQYYQYYILTIMFDMITYFSLTQVVYYYHK